MYKHNLLSQAARVSQQRRSNVHYTLQLLGICYLFNVCLQLFILHHIIRLD